MATHWKVVVVTSLVAALAASLMLNAQFHGEDEVGVYVTADWLVEALKSHDLFTVARVLVGSNHPPGRYILATFSFLLFGSSVFAFRLPSFLIWIAVCVLAADTARRLAGYRAGLITGILLGASGLFNLEAIGFGHGPATFWVMLFIWLKIKNPVWGLDSPFGRRQYLWGGVILAAGFLWFTSLLPIVGMYHLFYAYRAIKEKKMAPLKRYVFLTAPFILFYVVYYLFFLGVPYYAFIYGIRSRPVGQLHQYLARSGSTSLNIESFIDNLKGLNWYHLPFASWMLLLAGMIWQWRNARVLFVVLTPYALLFSFYFLDSTLQHFLSYYIWIVPFGVAALWRWGQKGGSDWHGVVICSLLATCVGTAVLGYVAHMRRYTELEYPYALEQAIWGKSYWRMNLVRPLPQIAADLPRVLAPNDRWTVTIDGALPMYYFPDSRYISADIQKIENENGRCWQLKLPEPAAVYPKAVVRSRDQPPMCDQTPTEVITYPNSRLVVEIYRLRP